MSEYTKYYVVKSSSEHEVQNKLNIAKVKSVVDADKSDYWFKTPKRNGIYNWVVVSAPVSSGFVNGQFSFNNQFDIIGTVFDTFILFFQEEDTINWSIKIKIEDITIEKHFIQDKETVFSEDEKVLFSKCFDRDFLDFNPFLHAGKSANFLNFVGIPYMEMNDQDKLPTQVFGDKYSLLKDELID